MKTRNKNKDTHVSIYIFWQCEKKWFCGLVKTNIKLKRWLINKWQCSVAKYETDTKFRAEPASSSSTKSCAALYVNHVIHVLYKQRHHDLSGAIGHTLLFCLTGPNQFMILLDEDKSRRETNINDDSAGTYSKRNHKKT